MVTLTDIRQKRKHEKNKQTVKSRAQLLTGESSLSGHAVMSGLSVPAAWDCKGFPCCPPPVRN